MNTWTRKLKQKQCVRDNRMLTERSCRRDVKRTIVRQIVESSRRIEDVFKQALHKRMILGEIGDKDRNGLRRIAFESCAGEACCIFELLRKAREAFCAD